jgi:hypothetical protein
VKKTKKTAAQLNREIATSIARGRKRKTPSSKHLLTTNRLILVESDGDQDTMTWSDFADANREMPELADVADELRRYGRTTIGGGASPFTVVRLAD